MKKAYVILAHNNPGQLSRLVRALDDGDAFFFIHIDKASKMADFESLANITDSLQFIPRVKSSWATFGIVQAGLNGLRAVRNSGHSFRHVILLSGHDYPIKSNAFINRFSAENADKSFLEYFHLPAPDKWQNNGGLFRVNKYFFGLKPWQLFSSRSLNFLSRYIPVLARKVYNNMEPYAGSMWWMLNMQAVSYILDFVNEHPDYAAFHRHTFAVDEVFFHMILLNARNQALTGTIVNNDKRYIKWKNKSSSHPETLTMEFFGEMIHSDALFARKFAPQPDSDIIDLIDSHRHSTENTPSDYARIF